MQKDDVIYRQAVIEALESIGSLDTDADREYARGIFNALPSAEPDLNEWCHDCKEYDSEKHCCPRFNRVIRQAMKDAQLERKKGQWIPHHEVNMLDGSTGGVTCSVCEWSTHNKLHLLVGCPYRYCPNCGSYMEGNADE